MRPDGARPENIAGLLESGRIKPVIDRVVSLEQAYPGLESLALGRAKGKVVVKVR
ncbi:hypothetical protein ALQ20_200024 [Pseudomonas syringae pv. atrofaciens]|nr:hypothetical protein ALQ20_200024 [Pseudomonas syringae pv. atrofaciens]